MDARLQEAFLSELEALEKFRVAYSGMYPQAPLASEDPDVRRLLEALALFTARTRLASQRNVEGALLRIIRQHFPYLLSPVPAMFMLRGTVSRSYVEVSTLPRGSQVNLVLRGDEAKQTPDSVFVFHTAASVRLLPIELEGVETFVAKGRRGARLALRFGTGYERHDEIEEISLHIDYLDDLHSSLLVLHALQANLLACSVVWTHAVDSSIKGDPCQVEFGAREPQDAELEPLDHPLYRVRAALGCPQAALSMRITGIKSPRNWQNFSVVLDLGEDFPSNLQLNVDSFQLHVVPVVNVQRGTADPITHDGTLEQHRVLPSDPAAGFVPISLHAVYRKSPEGLVPLEPAILRGARDSYEAQLEGKDRARRAYITLALPDAVEQPETVVVEALWHQPAVSEISAADCKVQLQDRYIQGVRWDCLGSVSAHLDSDIENDRQGMLDLLSIRGQRLLGLEELRFLLQAFGATREPACRRLIERMTDVRIVKLPSARRANAIKHVYEVEYRDLLPTDMPRLQLLSLQLHKLLAAWAQDEVIELVVRVPNLKKELRFS